ncbi:MAG: tetratricopeptide repeat protein [Candidatus Hydrothermarchaeaceae archaeon]
MTVFKLLEESKKAFHDMDWKRLAEINKKIVAKKPEEKIENLANGFYYYALAKLEKEQEKVILDLDKAASFFKSIDAQLASMADIEKLILLSEFDEKGRGRHLLDLAELTQGLFIKTGDHTYLQLAIDSFNNAKPSFSGKELEQIILSLQFCCGTQAPHSENPGEQYRGVIRLCGELKAGGSATRARSKMNAAIAHHNLAFLSKDRMENIKLAVKLSEEAIEAFEQLDSKPETVKAKQSLANVLRDASDIDTANAKEHLKRAITLKKEVAELLLEDGFSIDSGYEDLDIGTACMELAVSDSTHSNEHFDSAIIHFNAAAETFGKAKYEEGLGHAKAGIAAVYRNRGAFEDAAKAYEEAIALFKQPVLLGRTKQNLALTYKDMAKTTGKKAHLKKAEKLEKEAAELLVIYNNKHEPTCE